MNKKLQKSLHLWPQLARVFYSFSNLCCSSDLNSREQETLQPVHVINVDIQDNHEEATLGAFLICELCQCVSVSHQHFLNTFVHSPRWQVVNIQLWHFEKKSTIRSIHRRRAGRKWPHVLKCASLSNPADPTHRRHGEWNRGAPPRVWGEE